MAIVANNPAVRAGAVDSPAAIKAMDFIATADAFGLPLVFLADNPGVMAGTQAERDGILKWGGKMFKAQRRARVPKLHVTMRKSFGFGAVDDGPEPVRPSDALVRVPGRHDGRDAGGQRRALGEARRRDAGEGRGASSAPGRGAWRPA